MTLPEIIFALIFWLCLGSIVYSYAIYAVMIRLCAGLFGRPAQAPDVADEKLPKVSLLIAAYNEAEVIERRILNALETDYPADRFEIVVASDGSKDATAEIVSRYQHRGVRLLNYQVNRGKATVLNDSVPQLSGQIVAFSDANTFFDPSSVRSLARWFADEAIGTVCGRLILNDPKTGRNADSLYWKYETYLKKTESRLGALLGSNGAIYALRRDHYVPIPSYTLVDDFVIPLIARLKWGGAIIYDTEAIAREQTPADIASEFHRRTRIGAGGFQSIVMLWRLLNPRQGWVALTFFSHKVLRWICPLMMLAMIVANIELVRRPLYRDLLALQGAFYLIAGLAAILPAGGKALKPARLAAMFVGMNAALLVGLFRWMLGRQGGKWRRTSRAAELPQPAGVL